MEPKEIKKLEELKEKVFTKTGGIRKGATKEMITEVAKLQTKYDEEHAMELLKGADIGVATKEILLNVCGRQVVKTVPK